MPKPAYAWEDPRRINIQTGAIIHPQRLIDRFPPAREARTGQEHTVPQNKTYLIGVEGSPLVKIGLARNPKKRLVALQTGQPVDLSLLWTCDGDFEQELHQKFAKQRVRGEWFDLTPLGAPTQVVADALHEIRATRSR